MSNDLVINPHQFPFPFHHKTIRSSSLRGTNISSSPKSASLTPNYPIPVPYSRIRSSKNTAIFYSKLSKTLRFSGSKTPSGLLGVTRRYLKQSSIDWIRGRLNLN